MASKKRFLNANNTYVSRAAQIEHAVILYRKRRIKLDDLVRTVQIAAGCAERDRFIQLFPQYCDAICSRTLDEVLNEEESADGK